MNTDLGPTLVTPRLRLRPWRDQDIEPYAALCADREVMRHFPWTMDRAESEKSMARFRAHFAEHGWGPWVVVIPGESEFAGVIGLSHVRNETHFTPAVEVAWRLFPDFQGRGYATEAAGECVRFGFEQAGLEEIVAFCTPDNIGSRRVMEKLGMTRDPADDFDHPMVPPDHPMRRCVLYRLRPGNRFRPESVPGGARR